LRNTDIRLSINFNIRENSTNEKKKWRFNKFTNLKFKGVN